MYSILLYNQYTQTASPGIIGFATQSTLKSINAGWDTWLKNQLANSNPYRVKVSKIGRRVLFEVDPNFQTKRDKALRRIQATLAREQQLAARESTEEIPGETDSQRLGREFVRQNYPFIETDEEYTQRVGETIYECAESGDRYEER